MITLLKPSIVRPEHKITQDEMVQTLLTLFPEHPDWKKAEAMIRNSQVQQRCIVRPLTECVVNSGLESMSLIYSKEAPRYGLFPRWVMNNPEKTVCFQNGYISLMESYRETGPAYPIEVMDEFATITFVRDCGPDDDSVIVCAASELSADFPKNLI